MRPHYDSFWKTAFNWHESITPKVLHRTLIFFLCSIGTTFLCQTFPDLNWTVGPIEISGAALGLLMIVRTNAGYDRWWEARKLWGGIVNQSRNLAIACVNYGVKDRYWQFEFLKLMREFSEASKVFLRGESINNHAVEISNRIAYMLGEARQLGHLDGFAFQALEIQRSQLIDHLGGCERILKTPIPRILDIKVRRFLAIYLLLVPLGLTHKMGLYTPFMTLLLSYSLLALDQIGVELQNPFARERMSSLPLDDITTTIEKSIHSISNQEQRNRSVS